MFKYLAGLLLAVSLFTGSASAQTLNDTQKVDQSITLVRSVVCESDTCRTRQKDLLTRLTTFKGTLPVQPPPGVEPVYVTLAAFEAEIAALKGRLSKLETGIVTPPPPPPPPTGDNPWTYTETFDSYADGSALHGQGGWLGWNSSGETNYKIASYLGSKVAEVAIITHSTITRDLSTAVTKGSLKIVMAKSTSEDRLTDVGFALRDSNGSGRMYVVMQNKGHIALYDHATGSYHPILSNFVAGALYEVEVQFDQALQPNKYRARAKVRGGTTEGVWSQWALVNGGSYERIQTIIFDTEWSGGPLTVKGYFDFIGPADISQEPSPTAEICGNGIDDNSNGQIDEGCTVAPPPPPPTGELEGCGTAAVVVKPYDAFYEQARLRADCQVAYKLTQAQTDRYRHPNGVPVIYDPVMDAAKWQWTTDIVGTDTPISGDNIRMPINLVRPQTGSARLLIVSDHRWDSAWLTEFKQPNGSGLGGWKWLQITCASGDQDGLDGQIPNAKQRICMEPQMIGIGDLHHNDPEAFFPGTNVLSIFGVREYQGWREPTTLNGICQDAKGGRGAYFGEVLAPLENCFKAYPNTWTRIWLDLELKAGDRYGSLTMYMADENQEPVAVIRNAQVGVNSPVTQFWYEYDTSREERVGGPMAAWGRNVVVLKNVTNVTPLLVKPVKQN